MLTAKMSMDELLEVGEIDAILLKAKEKAEQKIRGKVFAGMDIDDVVQEVIIKVFKSLPRYDKEKAKLTTFVDHVIENMIRDMLRKAGKVSNLQVINAVQIMEDTEETIQLGEIDQEYSYLELMMDIMNGIGLNEREKEIFQLRSNGYAFKEIAEAFGVSRPRMSQLWKGIVDKYNANNLPA